MLEPEEACSSLDADYIKESINVVFGIFTTKAIKSKHVGKSKIKLKKTLK